MSPDTAVIMVLEILNSITILVLLALGLALIFGMMRIVNLAQGEFFTVGAFAVGNFSVGRYQYPEYRIVMTTVAAGLMLSVYLLFRYTAFGRRARATIANPDMAAAAGINTPRLFMLTFGLGAGLAGAAGAI